MPRLWSNGEGLEVMQAQTTTSWAGFNTARQNFATCPPTRKFPKAYCWPSSFHRYTNERQGTLYRSFADWLASPDVLGKLATRKLIETAARVFEQMLYRTWRESEGVFRDGQDQLARDLRLTRQHVYNARRLLRLANLAHDGARRGEIVLNIEPILLVVFPSQWREWLESSPWMRLQRRDRKPPQAEENTANVNQVDEPIICSSSNFRKKSTSETLFGLRNVRTLARFNAACDIPPEKPPEKTSHETPESNFTAEQQLDPDHEANSATEQPEPECPWPEVWRSPARVLNMRTPAQRKADEIAELQRKYGPLTQELPEGALIPPNHPERLRHIENVRLDFTTANAPSGAEGIPPPPTNDALRAILARAKSVPAAPSPLKQAVLPYDSNADRPRHLRPDRSDSRKFTPRGAIDWSQF